MLSTLITVLVYCITVVLWRVKRKLIRETLFDDYERETSDCGTRAFVGTFYWVVDKVLMLLPYINLCILAGLYYSWWIDSRIKQ